MVRVPSLKWRVNDKRVGAMWVMPGRVRSFTDVWVVKFFLTAGISFEDFLVGMMTMERSSNESQWLTALLAILVVEEGL